MPTSDLPATIEKRITAGTRSRVWIPDDFVDLGERKTVERALQRLTKRDVVRRVDRGLYDRPGHNPLTKQASSPDYREVLEAIARRDQIRLLVDGITAANDLGLTDAVPARVVVHTDTRRRTIKLGNLVIAFKLTAPSKLYWAGRPAMRVVQALHWLKDTLETDHTRVRTGIRRILAHPEHGAAIRKDLEDGLKVLPGWMQSFVRDLLSVDPVGGDGGAGDDDHHHHGGGEPRAIPHSTHRRDDDGHHDGTEDRSPGP